MARTAVHILAGCGLFAILITATPLVKWCAFSLAGTWNEPSGDVLIVLGAAGLDESILGDSSYWRSVYAIRAFRERPFARIVLSGGGGSREIAASMADFLRCHGVPPDAVSVDVDARTTRENAIYTKRMLEHVQGRAVLMTSDYHMFRAYRSFRKEGLNVVPSPIPDAIKRASSFRGRFGAFVDIAREAVAIVYYFSRGWI